MCDWLRSNESNQVYSSGSTVAWTFPLPSNAEDWCWGSKYLQFAQPF